VLNPGDPGVEGALFSESSCTTRAPRNRSKKRSDLAAPQAREEDEAEGSCAYHSAGEQEGTGQRRLRRAAAMGAARV
jgi:hypothetical protein